jgi:16S rRNA (cytosine967-C5)-methyltransferase
MMNERARTSLAPGAATLAEAARAIALVASEGRAADMALSAADDRPDRAAVRAIALGTLRWYLRLTPAIAPLLARDPAGMAPELHALLIAAAHQVEYSRAAPEVSVHLAVDATRALGQARASGFVNAVLRRFVRERVDLLAKVDANAAGRHAHPAWLVEMLRAAWPEQLEELLAANNVHPPMTLRVDLTRQSVAACSSEFAAAGRAAFAIGWLPCGIQLEHPAPVAALPGFREGRVSVQDAAAQLAALLLQVQPGHRVLDACAAPGGKTGHLLECAQGEIQLLAVDIDVDRLAQVRDTLDRLGRKAQCMQADLSAPWPDFLLRDGFDRILLDAPCSATGVIRRHPDIKLLRRPGDLEALRRTQAAILRQAFAALRPGGRLLYCTCSVLPAENEKIVTAFLAEEVRAKLLPWPAEVTLPPGALQRPVGTQLLPGAAAATDGFYYACVTRQRDVTAGALAVG